MKKLALQSVGLAMVLGLAGCTNNITDEQAGTVVGAVAGGVVGSQLGGTAATIGGSLVGGFVGNRVGASMDR